MSEGPQPLPVTHTHTAATLGTHNGQDETHTHTHPAATWPVTVLCRKYSAEHFRQKW